MASRKNKNKEYKRFRQKQRKRTNAFSSEISQLIQDALLLDKKITLSEESLLRVSYTIKTEPLKDSWISTMTPEDQDEMERAHQLLLDENPRAVSIYEKLHSKYPNNPTLHNNLMVAKNYTDSKPDSEVIEKQFKLFPSYLFAVTNYGHFLIGEDRETELPSILKNKFTLNELYPEREVFHMSEHLAFWGLMARYFLKIGRFSLALRYHQAFHKYDCSFSENIGLTFELMRHPLMTLVAKKAAEELTAKGPLSLRAEEYGVGDFEMLHP